MTDDLKKLAEAAPMSDVEKVARAMREAAAYLRKLEGNMLANDADMMLDACDAPSTHADALEAAIAAMGEREADKITQDEVAAMFGPYMPIEAALLIDRWTGTTTGLHQALAKMAASPRPEAVEEIAAIAESLRQAYPMEASRILILLGKAQPSDFERKTLFRLAKGETVDGDWLVNRAAFVGSSGEHRNAQLRVLEDGGVEFTYEKRTKADRATEGSKG